MASASAAYPLRRQRQRKARNFALRVSLLLALIGGVAYAAWFAPWSRHAAPVKIEAAP